ncbi:MAG: nucleotidyltransferase family protein [Terriglobia bacterium]
MPYFPLPISYSLFFMIAGLILAAGESSRMGRDKALLIYCGQTFLETIIAMLREAGIDRIAVVLGHHAEEIRQAANLAEVEVVINPEYRRGQTSSLQAGLRALDQPNLEGLVLCLVDHPTATSTTVRKLVESFRLSRAPVVIPTHQVQRGHPVLISRTLFDELLNLGPEQGANLVVHNYRDRTSFVEVDDGGILLDVDDDVAYRRLSQYPS